MSTSEVLAKIRRYYLFWGPAEYLKSKKIADLRKTGIAAGYEDFDFNSFEGRGVDIPSVINTACTPPFGSPLRVVVLREVEKVASKGQEYLAAFLPHIPEYTCLVMTCERPDQRRKLFKVLLGDRKACFYFDDPPPKKAIEKVLALAQSLGNSITEEAAAYLVNTVGCDLGRLETEVEKLALYVGPGAIIQQADVATMCGVGVSGTLSDLPDKVAAGDLQGALLLLDQLLRTRESEGSILYRLKDLLLRVNTAKTTNAPPAVLARIFGFHDQQLRQAERIWHLGRDIPSSTLMECLHLIYETEIALRSGLLPRQITLSQLVCAITQKISSGVGLGAKGRQK